MIVIGLGANLPTVRHSPAETIEEAKAALERKGIRIVASSRTWLTAPVPVSDQPWYYNAVVGVETLRSPASLMQVLHDVERSFGRVRGARNAARVLDLDLILWNGQVIRQDTLIVPHSRMHERAFVLLPLREIVDQDWSHPVLGLTIDRLIRSLPKDQEAKPLDEQHAA